jgi:hypothetical protein
MREAIRSRGADSPRSGAAAARAAVARRGRRSRGRRQPDANAAPRRPDADGARRRQHRRRAPHAAGARERGRRAGEAMAERGARPWSVPARRLGAPCPRACPGPALARPVAPVRSPVAARHPRCGARPPGARTAHGCPISRAIPGQPSASRHAGFPRPASQAKWYCLSATDDIGTTTSREIPRPPVWAHGAVDGE